MPAETPRRPASPAAPWTFLTNHSHVLICLSRNPRLRLRELAELVGITDRAVFTIIGELEAEGYLEKRKVGRRNEYVVHAGRPMRHAVEGGHTVDELLGVMVPDPGRADPDGDDETKS